MAVTQTDMTPTNSAAAGSSTSGTITLPATVAAGQYAVIVVSNLNNSAITVATAGWTERAQVTYGAQGGRVFTRALDGSEGGQVVQFNHAIGTRWAAAGAVLVGAGTPEESAVVTDTDGDLQFSFPQITPTFANPWLLAVNSIRWLAPDPANPGTPNMTAPGNWTERTETVTTNGSGSRAGAWMVARQLTVAANTQTGAATGTAFPVGVNGASWLFAFPEQVATDTSEVGTYQLVGGVWTGPSEGSGGTPPPDPEPDVHEGYDPVTNAAPGERTQRAYFDNTGLYSQSLRDALVQDAVSADLTTTSNGQVFEGRDFINDVVVAHSGVVFKHCRFRKGIDVGGLPSGSTVPKVIYCDALQNNGVASTSTKNFVSGNAHVYRSNISGYLDNGAVKTANDNTGHLSIFMDCFMHDSRLVDDPGQPGRSHNDSYQSNQNGARVDLIHCTIFGSGTNNFSAVESWGRDFGPHWTAGATPYLCTFENPSTGGDPVGRINAGAWQLKSGTNCTGRLLRCLVAGSMFRVTNSTDNPCTITDNEIATEHMDSGNNWAGGSNNTLSGNTNWKTGVAI